MIETAIKAIILLYISEKQIPEIVSKSELSLKLKSLIVIYL